MNERIKEKREVCMCVPKEVAVRNEEHPKSHDWTQLHFGGLALALTLAHFCFVVNQSFYRLELENDSQEKRASGGGNCFTLSPNPFDLLVQYLKPTTSNSIQDFRFFLGGLAHIHFILTEFPVSGEFFFFFFFDDKSRHQLIFSINRG